MTRSVIEQKYIDSVNRSLLIAALGGAVAALILGFLVAASLVRPIRALTAATRRVAEGDLDQKVQVNSKDEIGELAQSFNLMSEDLANANRSRKQMTADIAHDLRNPLTVLGGYLESLKDGKLEPTLERYETMQSEVLHLQKLVDDLRTLSLADAGELRLSLQKVNLAVLLEKVRASYLHQAEAKGVTIIVEANDTKLEANLDPDRTGEVLGNLVTNALRYTPEGGRITLSVMEESDKLVLHVTDTGCGISPADLPYIFERSYRGDPSRSGDESGLGLAICKSILELHGGTINVQSEVDGGSDFIIRMPLA
jgi:signal transduction histidine kinase